MDINGLVKIEQRLQDPPRFLMLPADEAAILGLPVMMGLLSKQIFIGVAFAFLLWVGWKRLKGSGGLDALLAATYWYLPSALRIFDPFPPSNVEVWEA